MVTNCTVLNLKFAVYQFLSLSSFNLSNTAVGVTGVPTEHVLKHVELQLKFGEEHVAIQLPSTEDGKFNACCLHLHVIQFNFPLFLRLCVGNNQQEIYCHDLPPCSTTNINMQVDGGWSELSEWSNCSNSCGGGFRFRERNCNNPTPQNNGLECIGCKIEHEECNKHACNEVKKISPWTSWLLMATNESSTKNGIYMEKRYRYSCRAPMSDPASLKIYLSKEETRACNPNEGGKCHRVNHTCEVKVCDGEKKKIMNFVKKKIH